ncbi:MAG: aminotransferase, partial [Bacillota bacterium]|nr:aminotransferase [Bacillota bacterium]
MQTISSFNPYRKLVVGADAKIPLSNGLYRRAINLDNAATTPPFLSVIEEINRFALWYSSVHRGAGYKSVLSTNIY